jgi:ribosomal protein L13
VKDITGQRFGKLVALRPTGEVRNGKYVWECQCDCGNITYVVGVSLQRNNTKSCGCLRRERLIVDLTGERFGRLVALRPASENKGGKRSWECQCDCGNITVVSTNSLTSGNTQSCGCMLKHKNKNTENSEKIALEQKQMCVETFNKVIRESNGMSYGKYMALLRKEKGK